MCLSSLHLNHYQSKYAMQCVILRPLIAKMIDNPCFENSIEVFIIDIVYLLEDLDKIELMLFSYIGMIINYPLWDL